MRQKFFYKPIQVSYHDKTVEFYLVACFSVNKISGQDGYVIYLASKIEKWEPLGREPLINALFFSTPEEAFAAGEEILLANAHLLKDLEEGKMNE